MQIVIEIPEIIYDTIQSDEMISREQLAILQMHIMNGTLLPKGHGNLIDVNRKITVSIYDEQYEEWGEEALTVLEALNRWSDEGVTVKDIVILADKTESEVQDADSD